MKDFKYVCVRGLVATLRLYVRKVILAEMWSRTEGNTDWT